MAVAAPILTCPTATAGDGFLPRIGVRGRLFAGMTVWVCGGLFQGNGGGRSYPHLPHGNGRGWIPAFAGMTVWVCGGLFSGK